MKDAPESLSRSPESLSAGPQSLSRRPENPSRSSESLSPTTAGPSRRTSHLARVGWGLAVVLPLVFLGVFFAYPVATLVGRGFTSGGTLDLGGVAEVLGSDRTWRVVGHTLLQASLGTVIAVALAIPGAHVLYRRTFPGRRALRALVAVPFVLPSVVVGVAFRALLAPSGPLGFLGWDRTLPAIVAALVFFNYGLVVRMVGTVWERLDPRAEEAARALGASPCVPRSPSPSPRSCPPSPRRPPWSSSSARRRSPSSSSSAGRATPPSRSRSGCRPRSSSTCAPHRC
ncbi:hypothetical protein GCM10025875_26830 [Litorihabitans aurantiacus]|uniref:ABC transmembrane type-1 domain-containing protein n=1 Tax=Litorihabitans aurantiacus TaxID=1930061 RepID=A0AA37XGQ6_9MICO|nr:hypothetical protein GCM10025875_26830 [Litorihabitans aurantiacus]